MAQPEVRVKQPAGKLGGRPAASDDLVVRRRRRDGYVSARLPGLAKAESVAAFAGPSLTQACSLAHPPLSGQADYRPRLLSRTCFSSLGICIGLGPSAEGDVRGLPVLGADRGTDRKSKPPVRPLARAGAIVV
ncbi:uncharacterized protein PSFLO_01224 [Pseudozyma flocculosa]|uniref:Uncharacterized protein n=1 Tax=Pseudozyma flocculosa TaxID=84751 RepID=A0A5C3ETR6_9BASI|nr:uncharacterized protein PSFLO_01224 [Pseudozyma flocculosa]